MDFETEEQQLEAIKKWWNENAMTIVGGVVVGIASISGWQYYKSESNSHAEQASVIYEQVLTGAQTNAALNDQLLKVNSLAAEYANTPYASLSALVLAKQQTAAGDFVKAQQQLDWVVQNAHQEELKYLAKIRLSRLYLTAAEYDQALALLNESYPQSFQAMALELKGDVLVSQGKKTLAKVAYTQALAASENSNRWLQLKIDDIGGSTIMPSINQSASDVSEPSA